MSLASQEPELVKTCKCRLQPPGSGQKFRLLAALAPQHSFVPCILALVPVDAGAGPARSLEVALDPGRLLLVKHEDEDTILPAAVIFLKEFYKIKKMMSTATGTSEVHKNVNVTRNQICDRLKSFPSDSVPDPEPLHFWLIRSGVAEKCYGSGYSSKSYVNKPGAYILENTPPPRGGGISADVIWGKKYEKAERKWGKM
jgi:hypothetical protein